MAKGKKHDPYRPLLTDPGPQRYTLAELRALCCQHGCMPRRIVLFNILFDFMADLYAGGVTGMVWVDGSYLTVKAEPDDIDFSLITDPSIYEAVHAGETPLNWYSNGIIEGLPEGLHGFVSTQAPEGSFEEEDLWAEIQDWASFWSKSRDGEQKGFVAVRLEEFVR